MADLITTCYGGRNRRCAEEFAKQMLGEKTGLDLDEKGCCELWAKIENELLNGQKLQGTVALKEVHMLLKSRGLLHLFPLISSINDVSYQGKHVTSIVGGINALSSDVPISKL
jgi:glycerol-3-phosphate dehydrogenase (NAD+)